MFAKGFTRMCAAVAIASAVVPPYAAAAGSKELPFEATLSIVEQLAPSASCSYLTGYISGTGHATHLGAVALSSQDCFEPVSPDTFAFTSYQVVLTSANGDQLFATYSGTVTVAGGDIGILSGAYTIYGGTGRFALATGSGTVTGTEGLSSNPAYGQIELSGKISY